MRISIIGAFMLSALAPASVNAQDSPLADSSWELVAIQSMDDTRYVPGDPSDYTLEFKADGTVALVSDCNRAHGAWASDRPNQLVFEALASSKMLCPPDSLDERYRGQFPWVRSYVFRDGKLHLATLADGAIISFRPLDAPPVVASLLGDDLRSRDPAVTQAMILDRLFGAYRVQEGLTASEEEIEAYLDDMDRTLAEELGEERATLDDLSPEEQAEVRSMRETMARRMIERWKVNQSLYDAYGGRVIFQQLGPEPLDAYRQFLELRRDAGDFVFRDAAHERAFWNDFEDESRHDFYPEEAAKSVFEVAPWEK
jgi:heat shock protein HslJ